MRLKDKPTDTDSIEETTTTRVVSISQNTQSLLLTNKRSRERAQDSEEFFSVKQLKSSSSKPCQYEGEVLETEGKEFHAKGESERPQILSSSSAERKAIEHQNMNTIYSSNQSMTELFELMSSKKDIAAEQLSTSVPFESQPTLLEVNVLKGNESNVETAKSKLLLESQGDFHGESFRPLGLCKNPTSTNHYGYNDISRASDNSSYQLSAGWPQTESVPSIHSTSLYGPFGHSRHTYAYPLFVQYPFYIVNQESPTFNSMSPKQTFELYESKNEMVSSSKFPTNPSRDISVDGSYTYETVPDSMNSHCDKQHTFIENGHQIPMVSNYLENAHGKPNEMQESIEEKYASISSPFLRKLLFLIECPESQHLCSWTKSGRSFVVWHPIRFENEVLPGYYKHSNFSSFVRQLNQYGFHKLHPEAWEFGHPLFLRNRIDLIRKICRKPSKRLNKSSEKIDPNDNETPSQLVKNSSKTDLVEGSNTNATEVPTATEDAIQGVTDLNSKNLEYPYKVQDRETASVENEPGSSLSDELGTEHSASNTEKSFEGPSALQTSRSKTEFLGGVSKNSKCFYEWIDDVYARLNMIQQEICQMQAKMEYFQQLLSSLVTKERLGTIQRK